MEVMQQVLSDLLEVLQVQVLLEVQLEHQLSRRVEPLPLVVPVVPVVPGRLLMLED
jgi:hypothetical protein